MSEESGGIERIWAVRGAIQVDGDSRDSILAGTEELMRELMARNSLGPERMVSCLFTCTDDLTAEFPAVAARAVGLSAVPLLCAREVPVPSAMPRVIRVLVHYYAAADHKPSHTYLGAAQSLRTDLEAAQ